MTKRKTERLVSGTNPLTPGEAGRLALWLQDEFGGDVEPVGRLLLLCSSFTHEEDYTAREEMLNEIETRLAPFMRGFDRMTEGELRRQLDALRRGEP